MRKTGRAAGCRTFRITHIMVRAVARAGSAFRAGPADQRFAHWDIMLICKPNEEQSIDSNQHDGFGGPPPPPPPIADSGGACRPNMQHDGIFQGQLAHILDWPLPLAMTC